VVVAGTVKHNNIPCHSPNMAQFVHVAPVEWWAPEHWRQVVGMESTDGIVGIAERWTMEATGEFQR